MHTVRILTFCGSLRSNSVNAAMMRAALADPPAEVELDVFDPAPLPLYNGDVEEAGLPAPVRELGAALEAAAGLLIFTPEYNLSYPAVTKNVIDWISRPPRPWEGKGITLVTTTPGRRAGQSLREHFDATMGYFSALKHYPALGIGSYGDLLEDGEIVDGPTIERVRTFISDFADHCIAEDELD